MENPPWKKTIDINGFSSAKNEKHLQKLSVAWRQTSQMLRAGRSKCRSYAGSNAFRVYTTLIILIETCWNRKQHRTVRNLHAFETFRNYGARICKYLCLLNHCLILWGTPVNILKLGTMNILMVLMFGG